MVLALRGAQSTVPGMTSALYGDIVGHSDFEMNMQPPQETTKDVEDSLDALMKSENIKRQEIARVGRGRPGGGTATVPHPVS